MNDEIDPVEDSFLVQDEYAEPASDLSAPLLPVVHKPIRKVVARRVVTTLTLSSNTCKWPIGDPTRPDFHYCGERPQSGRPYCDTHDRMSYQPVQRKKH